MIVHIFVSTIFWLNAFILSKTGTGLSNTKRPGQLALGTGVDYKKVFCPQIDKYVQVNQEYSPHNTIDNDQTARAIVLGP